jgi:cytochrome oxidase Cu insertion factor (SCO1/SenC/PrrC family)
MRYWNRMRVRLIVWGAALVVGVGIGAGIAITTASPSSSATPPPVPAAQVTWKAGAKPAPEFALRDERGEPISLQRFRGRPVILTFIDPLCTTFCPIEARVLDRLLAQLPAAQRPAIVSVSVNRLGDNAHAFRHDAKTWKLTRDWHWAVGSQHALARAWKAYGIGVSVDPKSKDVTHTEAAYLIDATGHERALYLWPFGAGGMLQEIRTLSG